VLPKGNGEVQIIEGDMIDHRRLQIDARKWLLAKALPKIYGDKLQVDNTHQALDGDGKPLSMLEAARRMAFVLNQASEELDKAAGEKPSTTRH
jgi:hypothetical protein